MVLRGTRTQSAASESSRTQLVEAPVLRLRLQARTATRCSSERHVHWSDDTVDNEHDNKRKSKRCCIYHPPHRVDDGSDANCPSDDEDDELD
ncbi:hypothetical protein CCYA_CCYA02G0466 [Cyanidiococcus yangmingshanensis]|nr:hypothetical protein CCYA_CCYA02G0466 [Cyanidiococcus yangmingshanensis]